MEHPAHQHQSHPPNFIDIPKEFYSDLTGKPLETCVMCEKDLLHSMEPYIIEKAFRYYPEYNITNTIFEYIMCLPCAHKMHQAMSKTSMQRIQEYFEQVDMQARRNEMMAAHPNDFHPWIAECIVKKTPRNGEEEYQICGQCIGDKLVLETFPYMMSHEASNEITALLSPQTLDEYNRFVDDFFGLPPAFKKALKDSPAVLV